MEVVFEKASVGDAERLLEVQREAFKESLMLYEDYGTNPVFESIEKILYKIQNHKYYKMLADGKIIGGFNVCKKGEGHYYINRIYVHPNYENQGIGKMAMRFMDNSKEFENALIWTLETPHKSYKNHYFYEKFGFVRTGYIEEISDKLKLIHYRKEIK